MDKLKELLGDLWTDAIAAKLGAAKVIIDDGTFIPKHRLDEVIGEKKAALELVKKHEEDLKVLKEKAVGNEALTAQITDLQRVNKATKEEYEAKRLADSKSLAVNVALMNAGVGDPAARELLAKSIDLGKLELDEAGKPKGFDAIIAPIKGNKAFAGMFGTKVIAGQEHATGDNPTPTTALEAQLADAIKNRKLPEIVALRRQIAEANATAQS
jgi:hypothetical protein